jgi:hypothetical protein
MLYRKVPIIFLNCAQVLGRVPFLLLCSPFPWRPAFFFPPQAAYLSLAPFKFFFSSSLSLLSFWIGGAQGLLPSRAGGASEACRRRGPARARRRSWRAVAACTRPEARASGRRAGGAGLGRGRSGGAGRAQRGRLGAASVDVEARQRGAQQAARGRRSERRRERAPGGRRALAGLRLADASAGKRRMHGARVEQHVEAGDAQRGRAGGVERIQAAGWHWRVWVRELTALAVVRRGAAARRERRGSWRRRRARAEGVAMEGFCARCRNAMASTLTTPR